MFLLNSFYLELIMVLDPNNITTSARLESYRKRNETLYLEAPDGKPVPYGTASTWTRVLPFWKSNYETLCRGDFDQKVNWAEK